MWFGLQLRPMPNQFNTTHFGEWFESLLEASWCTGEEKYLMVCYIMIALWCIWKTRNVMVFEEKAPNPSDTLFQIRANCTSMLIPKPTPNPNMLIPKSTPKPECDGVQGALCLNGDLLVTT